MPNWCQNTLSITGNKRDLTRFKKKAEDTGADSKTFLSLNNFVPMPKELEGTTSPCEPNTELRAKYGFDNWYDWHIANWGIKWDVEANKKQEGSNWIKFHFDSPWAPPINAIITISKMYPELTFEIEYAEPGMNFAGRSIYKNGEVISEMYLDVDEVTADMSY